MKKCILHYSIMSPLSIEHYSKEVFLYEVPRKGEVICFLHRNSAVQKSVTAVKHTEGILAVEIYLAMQNHTIEEDTLIPPQK